MIHYLPSQVQFISVTVTGMVSSPGDAKEGLKSPACLLDKRLRENVTEESILQQNKGCI